MLRCETVTSLAPVVFSIMDCAWLLVNFDPSSLSAFLLYLLYKCHQRPLIYYIHEYIVNIFITFPNMCNSVSRSVCGVSGVLTAACDGLVFGLPRVYLYSPVTLVPRVFRFSPGLLSHGLPPHLLHPDYLKHNGDNR